MASVFIDLVANFVSIMCVWAIIRKQRHQAKRQEANLAVHMSSLTLYPRTWCTSCQVVQDINGAVLVMDGNYPPVCLLRECNVGQWLFNEYFNPFLHFLL